MSIYLSTEAARSSYKEFLEAGKVFGQNCSDYDYEKGKKQLETKYTPWQIKDIRAIHTTNSFIKQCLHQKINTAGRYLVVIQYLFTSEHYEYDKQKIKTYKSHGKVFKYKHYNQDIARIVGCSSSYIHKLNRLTKVENIDQLRKLDVLISYLWNKYKKTRTLIESLKLLKTAYFGAFNFEKNKINGYQIQESSNKTPIPKNDDERQQKPIWKFAFEDGIWYKQDINDPYGMWTFADDDEIPAELKSQN